VNAKRATNGAKNNSAVIIAAAGAKLRVMAGASKDGRLFVGLLVASVHPLVFKITVT